MPYKQNQLKGFKKNSQNDPKVSSSSSLAIIWKLLLCRQSFNNKTQRKKSIEKNTKSNKCQVKRKQSLFLSGIWSN